MPLQIFTLKSNICFFRRVYVPFESSPLMDPWSSFPGMLILWTIWMHFLLLFVCLFVLQVQCCRFLSLFLQICLSAVFLFWFCGWEHDLILNFCYIIKNKQTLGLNLRKWLFIPKKSFTYLGNYWQEYFFTRYPEAV